MRTRRCVTIIGVIFPIMLGLSMATSAIAQASTQSLTNRSSVRPDADSAGTNIGNASQLTSTASGSLSSEVSDDWWVVYPATSGGSITVKVTNTTSGSPSCDNLYLQMSDTNGSVQANPVISANQSYNTPFSVTNSDRYFIDLRVYGSCNPVAGQPVTYKLDLQSGGGGTPPSLVTGSIAASDSINAWPPLQGATAYSGTISSNLVQAWYVLDKKSDSNPATIRVVDTTVYDSSQCSTLYAVFTDQFGNIIQNPVLSYDTAVTFSVPTEDQSSGNFYLELTDYNCTYNGSTAYQIDPEPADEWANPAQTPSGSVAASHSINAWPPLQGATTYSGSVSSSSVEAWYLLDKRSDSNDATIRVENTTVFGSSQCSTLYVVFSDQFGNTIQNPVLANNTAVSFSVPTEDQGSGNFHLELTDYNCQNSGDTTYLIDPEPSGEWANPTEAPSEAMPFGSSLGDAGGPLVGGVDYFGTVSSPGTQQYAMFDPIGNPQATLDFFNTTSNQSNCLYLDLEVYDSNGDVIQNPVLGDDTGVGYSFGSAGPDYIGVSIYNGCSPGTMPDPTYVLEITPSNSVTPQNQTIMFTTTPPTSPVVNDTYNPVKATATSGLPVTLSIDSTATSICSISGSASGSAVTFNAAGTCTIDANQGGGTVGGTTYLAAPQVQQVITVGGGCNAYPDSSSRTSVSRRFGSGEGLGGLKTPGTPVGIATSNWSGYVATSTPAKGCEPPKFISVTGTWIQPKITCTSSEDGAEASFWVGIDGGAAVPGDVEQVGTDAQCVGKSGTVVYSAWWEMYNKNGTGNNPVVFQGATINANNKIQATVSYSKGGFTLTIKNQSLSTNNVWQATPGNKNQKLNTSISCATPGTKDPCQRLTAEWVMEPAPNFGIPSFPATNIYNDSATVLNGSPQPISGFTNTAEYIGNTDDVLVHPTALNKAGNGFTEIWSGSGEPTITSFSPASGKVGTVVTVYGTNLDIANVNLGAVVPAINGTTSIVNTYSATSLTFAVPKGATTGRITITTGFGVAKSATNFTVK